MLEIGVIYCCIFWEEIKEKITTRKFEKSEVYHVLKDE